MSTSLDALELEIRRLTGVAGVGFSERDGLTAVHILVSDKDAVDEVRRRAAVLGKAHIDGGVSIEIDDGDGPVAQAAETRVRLITVRRDPETGETEVHLEFGRHRSVGRGPVDLLKGSAEAVLEALGKLGIVVPYRVGEVVAIGQNGVQTVLVEVMPTRQGMDVRHGAADGATIEEAACRATLHALNRWLSGPNGFHPDR